MKLKTVIFAVLALSILFYILFYAKKYRTQSATTTATNPNSLELGGFNGFKQRTGYTPGLKLF